MLFQIEDSIVVIIEVLNVIYDSRRHRGPWLIQLKVQSRIAPLHGQKSLVNLKTPSLSSSTSRPTVSRATVRIDNPTLQLRRGPTDITLRGH